MPTLVVQMGHCYRKSGATGTAGEQDYATLVARECVRLLSGLNGWIVNTTLADENDYSGAAFAAIHCDGSTSSSARGASVGYRTPEGQALGQAFKRAYHTLGWSGGFRPDNYTAALAGYYGVRNAVNAGNRRAFIIECGFMTSPEDRALLVGKGGPGRVAMALGIALGIITEDNMATPNEIWSAEVWHHYEDTPAGRSLAESLGNAPGDLTEEHSAGEWLTNAAVRTAILERRVNEMAPQVAKIPALQTTLNNVNTVCNQILTKLNEGGGA